MRVDAKLHALAHAAKDRAYVYLRHVLLELRASPPSREVSLAITKVEEAMLWLDMQQRRLNEEIPG